ncbi:regulatory protein RecX [Thermomonas sp.]|uniref:regulatory protein RecX n=1 Tax=Thermomonas sp. TaxID=1971895 RepID=UPI0035AE731C
MIGPGGDGDETSSSARKRRRRPEPSPIQRALGLLTRREHSRKELARKLGGRGIEAGEAAAVVQQLAEAGWQDDARFAESLVRSRAASGYGPGWIRAELGTHGLGAEAVSAALAGFEEDWSAVARDLVRRRFGDAARLDLVQRRKAADLLLRRGFAMGQVRGVLHGAGDED